jgi:hypothetical protein
MVTAEGTGVARTLSAGSFSFVVVVIVVLVLLGG